MTVQVILPANEADRLRIALGAAGDREIGGILMGEHVVAGVFRVADLTIQGRLGTFARFIRSLGDVVGPLARFFHRTGEDYCRFNYLGEWHSHPSFSLGPSPRDVATMQEIVRDPEVGARFAILLIVQLDSDGRLGGSVSVFVGNERLPGTLHLEEY